MVSSCRQNHTHDCVNLVELFGLPNNDYHVTQGSKQGENVSVTFYGHHYIWDEEYQIDVSCFTWSQTWRKFR